MTGSTTSPNPYDTDGPQPADTGQPAGSPPPGYPQPDPRSMDYSAGYGASHTAAYGPYPQPPQGKSKIAAGLLGLLLGWLGVHNFYLGHISKACTQLGLTVIGVVAYLVAFVMFFPLSFSNSSLFLAAPLIMLVGSGLITGAAVWGLIEGILILVATPGVPPWGVDAYGVPVHS